MSYVGQHYTYDVFISYSHGDPDGTKNSFFLSWSECFYEAFKQELQSNFARGPIPDVFFDNSERASEQLDPTQAPDSLKEHAEGAAIFLPLVSNYYPGSGWCQRELFWWRQAQQERNLAEGDRLIFARIWRNPPEPHREWQPVLDDLGLPGKGFYFFDPGSERATPFGWPGRTSTIEDGNFYTAITEIGGKVTFVLKRFCGEIREREASWNPYDEGKPVLYLHGRYDQHDRWMVTRQQLVVRGFTVFPDTPEAVETDPILRNKRQKIRSETLSKCDALLVVAPEEDAKLSDELRVVAEHDRAVAIDQAWRRGKKIKNFPVAILDPTQDQGKASDRKHMLSKPWFPCYAADLGIQIETWLRSEWP